jgi:hypothetical protein
MSVIVDQAVAFVASEFVPEGHVLAAVKTAYERAIVGVVQQDRAPVQVEVVIRVAPKETQ